MTISRRTALVGPIPLMAILPAAARESAIATRAKTPIDPDVRTLEDFGARGDYDPGRDTGSDDTTAIQQAIDWAYNAGRTPLRAIRVGARNYLCGSITVHPMTTLIGTGRQTSSFWCRPGTNGDWWSDRAGGAQKLMIHGIAWYGRGEHGLTSVCRFGSGGTPFGTEGILDSLWIRDAPDGYGLWLDGNVGFVRTLTVQGCATAIKVRGNGNQLTDLVAMESSISGVDLAGSFVRGLHVEATQSAGIPIKLNGDCRLHDVLISSAKGTAFDHLIEVDTTNYNEWTVDGIQLLGPVRVMRGIVKAGARYLGGIDPGRFTGAGFMPSLDVHTGNLSLAGQAWQAFSIEFSKREGDVFHRIGSVGNPGLAARFATRVREPSEEFTLTPREKEGNPAAGGSWVGSGNSRFAFDLHAPQSAADLAVGCVIQRSSAGKVLSATASAERVRLGPTIRDTLVVAFHDAVTGSEFDLSEMKDGATVLVTLTGFFA